MANVIVEDASKIEAEKLYRVSQVKGLFNQPHMIVQALFKMQPDVQRGRKLDKDPAKSSRYFLTGAAVQRILAEYQAKQ